MAGTGLPLHSLFSFLSVTWWGILSGLVGLALVWFGRYGTFEMVCTALVALMFVSMVGAAILTVPNLSDMGAGLVPIIPQDGGIIYVLSLAGGVGGTITLAAYGYWLREKGWDTPQFMRVMRIDNTVAYTVTGIFVIATLIVGAELLYSANIAVEEGEEGLLSLSDVLADRYGQWSGKVFLVGFWAAAMSSLIGVWNGVSLMFADFVGQSRGARLGPPGHANRWPPLQVARAVADLPADDHVVPRQARRVDPRVRRSRRLLHAVPGRDPALDPQHRPHSGQLAQQDPLQCRAGALHPRLRGSRRK